MELWLPPKPAIIIPKPEIRKPVGFAPAWLPGMVATPPVAVQAPTIVVHHAALATGASGTQSTITLPGTVVAGDQIIFADRANSVLVTPAGYTNFINVVATVRLAICRKFSTGSDAGATINGMTATGGNWRNFVFVLRRTPTATSATFASINQQATTGDPTTQTVTASGGTPPLIVFGTHGVDVGFNTLVFSPAEDVLLQNNTSPAAFFDFRYKIYNTGPVDHTVDMADGGTLFNHLASWYVSMS